MGTVFKKTFTKPLPAGAETFVRKGERFARWKDRKGKTRTAPLTVGKDGSERIVTRIAVLRRQVPRRRRRGAALSRPAAVTKPPPGKCWPTWNARPNWCARTSSPRPKPPSANIRRQPWANTSPPTLTYLEAKGRDEESPRRTRAATCTDSPPIVPSRRSPTYAAKPWSAGLPLRRRPAWGRGPGTATSVPPLAFCNWCVETNRLTVNPFDAVPKANEKADPRRQRRAMTEHELVKLLAVARERPLLEALTVRKGPRTGRALRRRAPRSARRRLERLGRERALIYKTLVLTGLRKGELASLTVAQLHLDDAVPFVVPRRRRRKEPGRKRHPVAG